MFLGALICGLGRLVSYRLAPETSGKSLAESSGDGSAASADLPTVKELS
ncbi:hypothetical protein [Streptomyces sp. NPDC048581]